MTHRHILLHAARNGNYDKVKSIVSSESGITHGDLNASLLCAATWNNFDIVEYLIENNADINSILDNMMFTIKMRAYIKSVKALTN